MADYKHVLAATDLHNDCFPVIKKAVEFAKRNDAKLSILTVVPSVPYYMASGLSAVSELETELEAESRQRLEKAKELVDIEADYYICHGTAKTEIVESAKQLGVDLIVIGSHGHRGVQILLGSTAAGVLHRAKCDVLVVRVKK